MKSPSPFRLFLFTLLITATAATAPALAARKDGKNSKDGAPPAASVTAAPAGRPVIDTSARNAVALDFQTGTVLLDKGADERIPTASMSKIMTVYTAYTYLRDGRAKLDDMLPVSEHAWRTGLSGDQSRMFVPLGGQVRIEDLLRGIIVQSGNDACVVLAEGLAGSEGAFVEKMNETAEKLGLTNSHFANVHGLPAPDHYMSPRDLATLSRHLIQDFPQYYHYEAEKEFAYNGVKQGNRNPLLYRNIGADGIKTGHTEEAGFGLVGSAIRNGRRIVFVLSGMKSMKERDIESEKVLEWAYREFNDYTIGKAGEPIDEAPVWLGAHNKVPAAPAADLVVTLPRAARRDLKVMAVYEGSIKAPIAKGQPVGKLVVTAPDTDTIETPLVATQAVDRLDALSRVGVGVGYLLLGHKN